MEEGIFVVKAVSAGFHIGSSAYIYINDNPVVLEKNENGHYRGLNIVIITPTGSIHCAKAFDTYWSSDILEEFIKQLMIPDGYIVAVACKDEGATKLTNLVKQWFADMGAKHIWNLKR